MPRDASPTVSVILPVYNRASCVQRSIESVLSQTYGDIELIVVDDASTDGSFEVARAVRDERLRCVRHSENRGGNAARNTGLSVARGPYLAFQDSDDAWLSDKLERQVHALSHAPERTGVVFSAYVRLRGTKREVVPADDPSLRNPDLRRRLLHDNVIGTPTVLVRRSCFDRVGVFDESLPRLQDWEMWIRISREFHFGFIERPLVHVYDTGDSISRNEQALLVAHEAILSKHRDAFAEAGPEVLGFQLWQVAHLHLLVGDVAKGRAYLDESIRQSRNVRNVVGQVMAWCGSGVYKRCVGAVRTGRRTIGGLTGR